MKYIYNLNTFLKKDGASFYLLGAFLTDGCVDGAYKIKLASKDYNWLVDIKNLICKDLPISNDRGTYVLKIYNKQIVNWFISYGCVPHKSLVVNFPKIPKKYLPDFFRGCLDGDGSLGSYVLKHNNSKFNSCYIMSASKSFAFDASKMLNTLKIEHYFYKDKLRESVINGNKFMKKNPTYRIFFTNVKCAKFLKWIYYNPSVISLKRKHIIANKIISYYE